MFEIELLNEQFKLPIYYNEKKIKLDENIINDLELNEVHNENETIPLYNYVFNKDNNSNTFSNTTIKLWSEYYTTDSEFLKNTQNILDTYKPSDSTYTNENYENITNSCAKCLSFSQIIFKNILSTKWAS